MREDSNLNTDGFLQYISYQSYFYLNLLNYMITRNT